MNNLPIGTLVLLKAPDSLLTKPLHSGMIGEVKDSSKFNSEIPMGNAAVDFPTSKSDGYTGYWHIPEKFLMPLDGGLLSEENSPYAVKKLVEDLV